MALTYYGRLRFVDNLTPLLRNATGLRRVVSAFTGDGRQRGQGLSRSMATGPRRQTSYDGGSWARRYYE